MSDRPVGIRPLGYDGLAISGNRLSPRDDTRVIYLLFNDINQTTWAAKRPMQTSKRRQYGFRH